MRYCVASVPWLACSKRKRTCVRAVRPIYQQCIVDERAFTENAFDICYIFDSLCVFRFWARILNEMQHHQHQQHSRIINCTTTVCCIYSIHTSVAQLFSGVFCRFDRLLMYILYTFGSINKIRTATTAKHHRQPMCVCMGLVRFPLVVMLRDLGWIRDQTE